MKTIDEAVLAGYNTGIEKNRLREGIGPSAHILAVSRKEI